MNDTKPPIGLKPRWLHDAHRIQEILDAMRRYSDAEIVIPSEWVDELNGLINNLYKH